MISLKKQYYIKELYEKDKLSLNEIVRKTGLSFKTVQKYAYMEDWNTEKTSKINKTKYRVLGEYIEIIDKWLEADKKEPRKHHHTIQRVFDRLKVEHKFTGSYGSVKKYINKKRLNEKQDILLEKAYLPMESFKCHAQVDFGKMKYYDKFDRPQKGYALTLSFPYSNMAFTQVFESENCECLLEGLKRIFEYINGVPAVIRADNMATAVAHVLKGSERELTENFQRFMLQYRFKTEFCNPCSGNEKGNVENKVGYTRRNFFVPVPKIENFQQFNKNLFLICECDGDRLHYKKDINMLNLWEDERKELLKLPENEYEIFKYKNSRVTNDGFVKVDKKNYSVPSCYCGKIVQTKIYYDKIEIYSECCLIKTLNRIYNKSKEDIDWRDYLTLLEKKPRALENTRFFNQMPKLWQEYLKSIEGKERKNAIKLLSEIVLDGNDNMCDDVVSMATDCGRIDVESVRQCYYISSKREYHPEPIELDNVKVKIFYKPDLSGYDNLSKFSKIKVGVIDNE